MLDSTLTFASLGAPISHATDPTGTEDALALSHACATAVAATAVAATAAFAVDEVVASSIDAYADAAIIAEDSGVAEGAVVAEGAIVAEGAVAAEGAGLVEPAFSSVRASNDIYW